MSDDADNSFMAMLSNKIINPGSSSSNVTEKKTNSNLKPSSLPVVKDVQQLLVKASNDVYLSSESDEPFEWINTNTNDNHLPTSVKDLIRLGFIDEEEADKELKIKPLQEFLKDDSYKDIVQAFEKIEKEHGGHDSKVYLLGEDSITVLILCIVLDDKSGKTAIVGLKSLLVQT